MKIEKHFVTFYSPGTFVAETTEKPIDSWDVKKAMSMARAIKERYDAMPYGFRFSTRSRGDEELDSKIAATSPLYWLGGKVETLAQVKARATKKDEILVSNMEINHYDRIITNTNSWSWTQPLMPGDVVLDFKVNNAKRRSKKFQTQP
jgi:hypothetical protein